ncbi:hypothetical protein MMARJ_11820 [Mycobacterium marseillense]|uniref:Uncharacterized protein n=2 Tax=Mycobacterium avium complex (MAC) TaxID=120793 RepID=A0ABM7J9B1_9MYCO|nr:hypothetical protein K883_04613 [Mycobacterium sp. TKK-01-0059]BBY10442.1 hypothetical protein MMARJ_11820 [Mycobacterium marseillense]GFG96269.1 hypothetical protein MTIM_21480 [Mycobacterium timonense]
MAVSLRAALLRTDGPPSCDLENRASGYPATLEGRSGSGTDTTQGTRRRMAFSPFVSVVDEVYTENVNCGKRTSK